ncbi:uncharacterized protein LOC126336105 [Schistocerca gregaria]|uniref:uncharacterized protein LOC126336105 n=1 Tax=Schistocerca gregaria TaxID=7010 RepID=UPI00211E2C48|nr:uncharacterized protein LOC126336105 [Schistocerca gregaria]
MLMHAEEAELLQVVLTDLATVNLHQKTNAREGGRGLVSPGLTSHRLLALRRQLPLATAPPDHLQQRCVQRAGRGSGQATSRCRRCGGDSRAGGPWRAGRGAGAGRRSAGADGGALPARRAGVRGAPAGREPAAARDLERLWRRMLAGRAVPVALLEDGGGASSRVSGANMTSPECLADRDREEEVRKASL